MDIRMIANDDLSAATRLVAEVFMQFEAPDYTPQGVQAFFATALHNACYMNSLSVYGAYEKEALAGVLATRNKGSHIALLFVDGAHQRQGIAKRLFQAALANCPGAEMTVNSSPYAHQVYRHLGFSDTDAEQCVSGIRFIPMRYHR